MQVILSSVVEQEEEDDVPSDYVDRKGPSRLWRMGQGKAQRGHGGRVKTKRQTNIIPQTDLVVPHDSRDAEEEEDEEEEEERRIFETKKSRMKGRMGGDSSTKRGVVKTTKTLRNRDLAG